MPPGRDFEHQLAFLVPSVIESFNEKVGLTLPVQVDNATDVAAGETVAEARPRTAHEGKHRDGHHRQSAKTVRISRFPSAATDMH